MRVFECRIVAGAKTKKEVQTTHKNNVGGTATFEEILTFDKPLGEHTIKVIPQNTHLLSWYLFSLSYAPTHQCMFTCMNMCAIFNLNLNESALAKMKLVSLVCFVEEVVKKMLCFLILYAQVQVWDKDTLSDDFMGEAELDLRKQEYWPHLNAQNVQADILESQLPTEVPM